MKPHRTSKRQIKQWTKDYKMAYETQLRTLAPEIKRAVLRGDQPETRRFIRDVIERAEQET